MQFGVGAYTMQLPGSTRAHAALEGKTTATSGKVIDVEGDSVCVHGDVTNAPEVLHGLRAALGRAGIEVRSALRAGKAAPGPREGVRA